MRRPGRARASLPTSGPADGPGLVGFALRHAQIASAMGSRQSTDRNGYVLPERTVPDYNLIYLEEGEAEWVLAS